MIHCTTLNSNSDIRNDVLDVLQYFSVFHYPLKAEEIYRNCPHECSLSSVLVVLEDLLEDKTATAYKGFYTTAPDIQALVARRLEGNALAMHKVQQARRAGNLIFKFPFVKFVGISGSLSKGYADPCSDFDFFIVTSARRLWICRTLLHIFKKTTFLAGCQRNFCMNYFLDSGHLEIEEKNRFTAIELTTLLPVNGYATYNMLMNSNKWVYRYLPNHSMRLKEYKISPDKNYHIKRGVEYILDKLFPERMNGLLMKLTDAKWRKKWHKKNYPAEDYDLAFKTRLYVSKNHPANYQKKVLELLHKKNSL